MTTATIAPAAPTSTRPGWIPAEEWERMPWSARMRAARRVLHLVRPLETDTGAVSATAIAAGESVADPADAPAPVSPDPEPFYPCAIGCGRWSPLVYCDPCATLHDTPPVTPPPAWLVAAHANRVSLDWQARRYHRHVCHVVGHRRSPRRPVPVVP